MIPSNAVGSDTLTTAVASYYKGWSDALKWGAKHLRDLDEHTLAKDFDDKDAHIVLSVAEQSMKLLLEALETMKAHLSEEFEP